MSTTAQKIASLRAHVANNKESYKQTGMCAASGAGAYYLAKVASEKVNFLKDSWWATPLAMAFLGHFLTRKNPAIGHALVGVAGYMGAMAYDWKSQIEKQKTASGQPAAKGLDDAGAFSSQVFESAGVQPFAGELSDAGGLQPIASGFDDGVNGFDDAGAEDDSAGDESYAIMG